MLGYSSVNELVPSVQAAYLSKKLQAAKADFAAADEARRALVQRDREAAAAMAEMHRDMAGHVVRYLPRTPLPAGDNMQSSCIYDTVLERLPMQLLAYKALLHAWSHN